MSKQLWSIINCLAFISLIVSSCQGMTAEQSSAAPSKVVPVSATTAATVILLTATATPSATQPFVSTPGTIQRESLSPATQLHYWLYLPSAESQSSGSAPALLVYLHGYDQSGSDLQVLLGRGIPMEIENGQRPPMVIISPQCPSVDNWMYPAMIERLHQLIEETIEEYGIDPQRVYLTGFSWGGDGVWALGIAHPEQFAALAPVGSDWYIHQSAWFDDQNAVCVLKDIPVWVFQGEMDEYVSPRYAQGMVDTLRQCGGRVTYTLYPGAGHLESSSLAYKEDTFYSWLMEQKRK